MDNKDLIVKAITAIGCIIAGLVGLYFKVEYSGWALLAGFVTVLSIADD